MNRCASELSTRWQKMVVLKLIIPSEFLYTMLMCQLSGGQLGTYIKGDRDVRLEPYSILNNATFTYTRIHSVHIHTCLGFERW